jgi:hypothetical protein
VEINLSTNIAPVALSISYLTGDECQEKANQYNLTAEVIATSKILLRYIRGDQSVNFLSGWRYQIHSLCLPHRSFLKRQ